MAFKFFKKSTSVNELKQNRNDFEQFYTCQLCCELFNINDKNKLPKGLPCQHSFCVGCIENWIKSTRSNNQHFSCPLCKKTVDHLKNASELPNNPIIVNLIESRITNFSGRARCPYCDRIDKLDTCFECNTPLCEECKENHFIKWKSGTKSNLIQLENSMCQIAQQMDQNINQHVESTLLLIPKTRQEIENRYQTFIDLLNKEKAQLFKTLDEISSKMEPIAELKKDTLTSIKEIQKFRSNDVSLNDKSGLESYRNNFQNIEGTSGLLRSQYNNLIRDPLVCLLAEGIESNERSLLGGLKTNEIDLADKCQALEAPKCTLFPKIGFESISQPNLYTEPSEPIKPSNVLINTFLLNSTSELSSPVIETISEEKMITKWSDCAQSTENPCIEVQMDHVPTYMTNFGDALFVCNEFGAISVFNISNDKCEKKFHSKLNFTNIRGIASNSKCVAFPYSSLSKEDKKKISKKIATSGIAFFNYTNFIVSREHTRAIDVPVRGGFIHPGGMIMTENFVYVCDKAQQMVYKLNLNGDLVQKHSVDGSPYDVTVNASYIAISDYTAHEVVVIDPSESNKRRKIPIAQANPYLHGPFNVWLTDENLLFVARNTNTEIDLFDKTGDFKTSFRIRNGQIYDFVVAKMPYYSLIMGCKINNQYKLLFYKTK